MNDSQLIWEAYQHNYLRPDVLWHGSTEPNLTVIEPRQAKDISGEPSQNKFAVYATADRNVAIALTLGERGANHGINHNIDNKLVSFDNPPRLRTGKQGYLYKLPVDTFETKFIPTQNPEWTSDVPVKPIDVEVINVDDYIPTHVRPPTEADIHMFNNPTQYER